MKTDCTFCRKAAVVLFVCVLLLTAAFPQYAFALNSDYMNPDKWINNSNVSVEYIDGYSGDNHITGYFKYHTDNSLGIYTDFEISETSLKENMPVYVEYTYHMGEENHYVRVGSEGIFDVSTDQGKNLFAAESNFRTGSYISSAQYTGGGYSQCYVDIALYVNGHVYSITKNSKLYGKQIYMELPTTVKSTKATTVKTTVKKEKKTAAAKNAKSKSKTSSAAKSGKSKKETTTKFKPSYNVTTTAAPQRQNAKTTAAAKGSTAKNSKAAVNQTVIESEINSEAGGGTYEMNPAVKRYLPLLIVLVIAGVAALIVGAVKGKKDEEPEKDEK